MSHRVFILLIFVFLSFLVSPSFSAFVVPIHRDPAALQYYVSVNLTTPTKPTNLVLDIGAQFSWVKCNSRTYKSKTSHTIPCNTTQCNSMYGFCPKDPNGTPLLHKPCLFLPWNPISSELTNGNVIFDSITLSTTTDGINEGRPAHIHNHIFSCATNSAVLRGLSKKVRGFISLSRSNISLPSQISRATSSPNIFALCLPRSSSIAPGAAIFGRTKGGSYIDEDLSRSLVYTPLIVSPFGMGIVYYGTPGPEYYIGVTSIKVNGKALKLTNRQMFVINKKSGYGGTRLRTVIPYTLLEPTFYAVFTEAFVKESAAMNLTVSKAPAPAPFSVCYEARDIPITQMGTPAVPSIELVMHSKEVAWKMLGENSMVRIKRKGVDVWCLGFVEETNMYAGVEIGAHQMENNLLEFDLHSNRFGFTSLVSKSPQTTCSNFRFN